MKKIITIIFCLGLIGLTYYFYDVIENVVVKFFYPTPKIVVETPNNYSRKRNYDFVSIADDFIAYSYQDLLDIIYTILDYGYDEFTFYCGQEYLDACLEDINDISSDQNRNVLTVIGNLVHPFNNFTNIRFQYDTTGKINLKVTHLYTKADRAEIENALDDIWNNKITSKMTKTDIIRYFHDYIVNNTTYDIEFERQLKNIVSVTDDAAKVNGVLFKHNAICSGYTDTMALILDRLDLFNYKVVSDSHVWNAVVMDNIHKHIDVTWDDPVVTNSTSSNMLVHTYFLITTKELKEKDKEPHPFDTSIYTELKKSE